MMDTYRSQHVKDLPHIYPSPRGHTRTIQLHKISFGWLQPNDLPMEL